MGCFSGIIKYLLFFFNFLIVVCGIVLIAIGGVIIANESQGLDSFTDFSVGGFAIAIGLIIFFIAFLGCCGAIKENSCMLTAYAVILVVLLILQLVLGGLALASIDNEDYKLDKKIIEVVNDIFNDYWKDPTKDKKDTIDSIQEYFKCCGVVTYKEWNKVPNSCRDDNKTIYKQGCAIAFKDAVVYNIKAIGIVAIVFALVELVGAVFACIVRKK